LSRATPDAFAIKKANETGPRFSWLGRLSLQPTPNPFDRFVHLGSRAGVAETQEVLAI
jgi:hypothetical protein